MNPDGWVIVGTKLDSKQLDKDLKNEQAKLKQFEKENQILIKEKGKAENELKKYYQIRDAIEEATNKKMEMANEEELIAKYIQQEEQQIKDLNDAYSTQLSHLDEINQKIQANVMHQELTKGNIDIINQKIEKANGIDKINNTLKNVGNQTENIIKKVARWGLAIFSIRSAYMLVRQAVSTISQYDQQIATDIQYIRFALASALKPIIEVIIDLVYKLLSLLNAISMALFNYPLFANATAKAFKKVNSGIKGSNKQAKELQKTLQGFDEMNILQDNGSVSTGGGGGGIETPSTDLSKLGEIKLPWVDTLIKNKKWILAILGGIVSAFIAIKKGFGVVKGLGIGIAVTGLIRSIQKIIDFIHDPSFDNFIGILEGIAIAVGGVAIAFGAWPVAIGAAIALVIIELVKYYDKIKEIFGKVIDWFDTKFLGTLKNIFGPIGNLIYLPFEVAIKSISKLFESFVGGIKRIIDGIVKLFNGDFLGGLGEIFGGLKDVLLAPFNALIEGIRTTVGRLKTFFGDLVTWIKEKFVNPLKEKFKGLIDKLKEFLGLQQKTNVTGGGGSGGFGGGKSGGRAKGGIFYPSKLPKLAVGGIINSPGSGVPYHGAYIGERGAEAVVPLTDSQQMQLLGATIGRYISVNLNNIVEMNGRVISREMKRVENEEDFAFNGG